jgi:hypothetical protein
VIAVVESRFWLQIVLWESRWVDLVSRQSSNAAGAGSSSRVVTFKIDFMGNVHTPL